VVASPGVVEEVVLAARLVATPRKNPPRNLQKKEMTMAMPMIMTSITMAMTMTMTMTMTLILRLTMTTTCAITDSDVADVRDEAEVVLEDLLVDARMDLDRLARTTRGQTHVLTAPHQPGFLLALLEEDHDARTTRGLGAPTAPDPTTASVKTQAHPPALMEPPKPALTAAPQVQDQSAQTALRWSFSELKGETIQETIGDLILAEKLEFTKGMRSVFFITVIKRGGVNPRYIKVRATFDLFCGQPENRSNDDRKPKIADAVQCHS